MSNNPTDYYSNSYDDYTAFYPFAPGQGLQFAPTQDHSDPLFDPHRALTAPDPSHLQPTPAPQTTKTMGVKSTDSHIPQPRHRKKDHGDSESFRLLLQSLGDLAQRALNEYSGTTAVGRVWLLNSWITYQSEHPQSLGPIIRTGKLGPRQGGGEMECTICGKRNNTLQRAMAHLFGHWKMSLFYCGVDGEW
jgi:hypothetical protein